MKYLLTREFPSTYVSQLHNIWHDRGKAKTRKINLGKNIPKNEGKVGESGAASGRK